MRYLKSPSGNIAFAAVGHAGTRSETAESRECGEDTKHVRTGDAAMIGC
jgi:hypothetical protein